MEHNSPQRESRLILVIFGGLILLVCISIAAISYIVLTRSQEFVSVLQTPLAPRAPIRESTSGAASAAVTAQAQLPLVLSDSFDSNVNNWDYADFEDDFFSNRERIKDGVLHVETQAKKGFFALRSPEVEPVEDFYLSADVRRTSGAKDGEYGIVFRSSDKSNFYWFGLDSDKSFFVDERQHGDWDFVITPRFANAIKTGDTNQLAVSGRGSHFDLFINNVYVASFDDERLPRGGVGVGFSLHAAQDATFEFDNYVLRAAPTSRELGALGTATALAPTMTAQENWGLIVADEFDKALNPNGWAMGNTQGPRVAGSRKIEQGVYRWNAKALDGMVWYAYPAHAQVQDFYLKVDTHKVSGPASSFPTVMFRYQNGDNYYRFATNDAKKFKIDGRYNGEWITIVNWTLSEAIRAGEANQVVISGEGSHFIFHINGKFVWELEDVRLEQGSPALGVDMEEGDTAVFEFDHFELRSPKSVMPTASATPRPRATSTPDAGQRAAFATAEALSKKIQGQIATREIVSDQFNDNFYQWQVNNSLSKSQRGTIQIRDGVYDWSIFSGVDDVMWYALPNASDLSDFYSVVHTRQTVGGPDMLYGFVMRYQDSNNFYRFLITDNGDYTFEVKNKGEWKTLSKRHEGLGKEQQEHLVQVSARNSHFSLAIDGDVVAEVDDSTIPSGKLGLTVAANRGDVGTVAFDNFDVRAP